MPTLTTIAATTSILLGMVNQVRDGDTFVVETTPIRLTGIAAPELSEPGGLEAKQFMINLVGGRVVKCELTGERSYDRMIGRCYLDGMDVGQAIVAAGKARDCPRFSLGQYAAFETPASWLLPLPNYCEPR